MRSRKWILILTVFAMVVSVLIGNRMVVQAASEKNFNNDFQVEYYHASEALGYNIAQDSDELYVYSYDETFETRLEKFYEKYPQYRDKVIFCNLNMIGDSAEYIEWVTRYAWDEYNNTSIVVMDDSIVETMLSTQEFVSMKSLGLEDDYANAYDFTKKRGSYNGKLYLATWHTCPGNFVYNSNIAQEVLGTSDPIKVQEMISTPEKFLMVAKKMKDAGYYMTTGINSLYDSNYENTEYATSFDNINFTEAKSLSVALTENEYDTGNLTWNNDWWTDLSSDRIFGTFSTTWLNDSIIPQADGPLYRSGQSCAGPLTYSWGGAYLGVTNQNRNQKLAALVIKTLCCDEKIMSDINKDDNDFVNNKVVNLRLAANSKSYSNQMGGVYNGQNLYDVWNQMALSIGKKDHISLLTPLKNNSIVKVGKGTYKINSLSKTTVIYTKGDVVSTTVNVPNTVTIRDVKYKVTEVGVNALKNNKIMSNLTIGKYVTTIGKDAFRGCTKLKAVNVKSTALKKIGANAFYGDKKLAKITLKTTKLTKKSIGKNALKGTNKKLTIKVPSKYVSKYKKYFKNKGNKKVKVKK